MHILNSLLIPILAFLSFSRAAVLPTESLSKRQSPDPQCIHGPTSRACWTNGYSIATDFDQKFPTTGNTVTYNLDLTNGTCNPDGAGARLCLLINNQFPGPTIRATWGDRLVINVKNSMQDNGTSIHWHGVRQYHSVESDGVNGITECPLAPGDTKTYDFQVGEGTVGAMIFDGPASGNYDEDLGPYSVTDWYHTTAFLAGWQALNNLHTGKGGPPAGDAILINGTSKNPNGGGEYSQVSIKSGKKYRLRLVNTGMDAQIRVSLDNHPMQVIAADFIPVHPFYTDTLLIAIGQRYDVIIEANQTAGNYWFRAEYAADCASKTNQNGLAIWTYDTVQPADPTSSSYSFPSTCAEPSLSPYWAQPVPTGNFASTLSSLAVNQTTAQIIPGEPNVVVWALNEHTINVAWDNPTLSYIRAGNTSYPPDLSVYPTRNEGQWNYWLIHQPSNMPPLPHPVHLHGHDFFVLGQGTGEFDVATAQANGSLNFDTPPRRDTALLPSKGWLVVAFLSNNPGAWLMHCHIAFHISQGLGMQFVESPDKITVADWSAYDKTCSNWRAYQKNMYWPKDDSGL